jgi:asparagine synthase (glutamine-hydrolysing)
LPDVPGIVSIIGSGSPEENAIALQRMLACMCHEPSYISGSYGNPELGLWVGWVSHPGAFSEGMPIWNEAGDLGLIFSGEDYTDTAVIRHLRARGHDLDRSRAGYLIHLYEELGAGFFETLNGRFNGVLVDLRRKVVVVFNDRYGLNRLYYHEKGGQFYCASEAKSLLKVIPELRRLDPASLGEWVSCGSVLRNKTLFPDIELLPGGSLWTFAGKHLVSRKRYFDPTVWETQSPLSGPEFYTRLKDTFAGLLPKYLRGDQPVAVSLTGGLDGRMIMAWADCAAGSLPCYTFGGRYRDSWDVRIARQVAKVCRQSHDTIVVDSGFLAEFPDLAEQAVYLSDGTMDVSGSVELYINRLAQEIAPVRLTGSYGSEIIRGNIAFKPGCSGSDLWAPEFARHVETAAATYQAERDGHELSFIAFKQVPWHHYARFSLESSQLTLSLPYLDNALVSLIYRAPRGFASGHEASLRLVEDGNSALAEIPTDRGLLLRRVPLLTPCRHALQQFTFKAEYAYDEGMPWWLAEIDHRLAWLRPERWFLGRHKFYHFRVWYRDHLAQYLRDTLLDPRTLNRPYFQRKALEAMVNGHLEGRRNYTAEIHRALTVELIERRLIESA